MLEFLRQHVNGLLGFTLVGVLVFVFALSFGQQSSGWGKGQSENVAISVRGTDVSETTIRYMLNMLGRKDTNDQARVAQMERTVIDALIERQLMLDLATSSGISASTEETEDLIAAGEVYLSMPIEDIVKQMSSMFFIDAAAIGPALLKDAYRRPVSFKSDKDSFDYDYFVKFVKYQLQVNEEDFVEQQRLELITKRIRQLLVSGVRLSPKEVRDNYNRANDTAAISYIRLIPTYFADRLDPTTEELAIWIEANKSRIEQYYEMNKYKYTNLEKMARASHILKKVAEDATEEETAVIRADIDTIVARINAGEDFATLAKETSEDTGSAVKGGDLGFNPKGKMVPEFDEMMFSLMPDQVSDVVKSKFGFHIIKLDSYREGNISLDDATAEIVDQLYRETEGVRLAEQTGKEYLAKLKSGVAIEDLFLEEEGVETLEEEGVKTPKHLNFKVASSSPFARNAATIQGVGKAPEIISAAFAQTEEAPVSLGTFTVKGDVFVVTLKERNSPNDEEFEKQKSQLTSRLLSMKQATWLRSRVAEMRTIAEKNGEIEISERYYFSGSSQPTSQAIDLPAKDNKKSKVDVKNKGKAEPKKPEAAQKDVPDNANTEEGNVE